MTILKPWPTLPTTFSCGTTTLSNEMARVSDARWPMFFSLAPTVMPGVLASSTKAVKALPALALASVRASTKYQFATPPFVIHCLLPFSTHLSPCLTAVVLMPATSLPAPGSVTQYYTTTTITTISITIVLLSLSRSEWEARSSHSTTTTMIIDDHRAHETT